MEETKANPSADQPGWSKWLLPGAVLVLVILFGFLTIRAYLKPQTASVLPGKVLISQDELEKQSGMRVTLVATTAVGGMVDFRFKVTDVDKAKKVLQADKQLPYLTVAGSNISLKPTPETLQNTQFENGVVYYILYPNSGNLVKPGSPVTVVIGDWQLEPIVAK